MGQSEGSVRSIVPGVKDDATKTTLEPLFGNVKKTKKTIAAPVGLITPYQPPAKGHENTVPRS